MPHKIGIDLVDVDDFSKSIKRTKSLKQRLFTKFEIEYCRNRGIEHLASRFAAKEAFFKAFNVRDMSWNDVEIQNLKSGKPIIRLSKKIKTKLSFLSIQVSLSQTKNNAIAIVIADY